MKRENRYCKGFEKLTLELQPTKGGLQYAATTWQQNEKLLLCQ